MRERGVIDRINATLVGVERVQWTRYPSWGTRFRVVGSCPGGNSAGNAVLRWLFGLVLARVARNICSEWLKSRPGQFVPAASTSGSRFQLTFESRPLAFNDNLARCAGKLMAFTGVFAALKASKARRKEELSMWTIMADEGFQGWIKRAKLR